MFPSGSQSPLASSSRPDAHADRTVAPHTFYQQTSALAGSISPAMMHQQPASYPNAFFAQPAPPSTQPRIRHPIAAPTPANTISPAALAHAPVASTSTALPPVTSVDDGGLSKALSEIRKLLTPTALNTAPARSASRLAQQLGAFDDSSPVPMPHSDRLEVAEALVARAGASAWSAVAAHEALRTTLEAWLATAVKPVKGKATKADEIRRSTALPLLQLFRELPLTSEHLRSQTSLPRLVAKINKADKANLAEDVRKLAGQLEEKWREVLRAAKAADSSGGRSLSPSDVKKRPAGKESGPSGEATKKRKIESAASAAKPTSSAAAAASLDLFGAGKALPSFSKKRATGTASAPVLIESEPNGFQQAMFAMRAHTAGPAATAAKPGQIGAGIGKRKVKKSVRWASEETLVSIREIESRADVDQGDLHSVGAVHAMDQQEGKTLHEAHVQELEEETDWEEPAPLDLPDFQASDYPLSDSLTEDLPRSDGELQREREAGSDAVTYADENEEPETPAEPSETALHAAEAERAGAITRKMHLGGAPAQDLVVQAQLVALREAKAGTPLPMADVAALSGYLAQLSQTPAAVGPPSAPAPGPAPPGLPAPGPSSGLPVGFDFSNALSAMAGTGSAAAPDMTGLLSQLSGLVSTPQFAPQPHSMGGGVGGGGVGGGGGGGLGDQSDAFRQATGGGGPSQQPAASGPMRRGSRRPGANPHKNTPCKFYGTKQGCFLGSECPWRHE